MCIQGLFKYLALLNSHFCTLSPPCTHPLPSHLLPSQNKILPHLCLPLFFSMNERMNAVPASVSLVLAGAPLWNNLLFYMNYHMKAANVILLQLCFMLQNCKWYRAVHICPLSGNNPSPSSPFFLPHIAVENIVSFLFILPDQLLHFNKYLLLQMWKQLSIWDSDAVRNIGSCGTYPLRMKLVIAG